MADSSYDSSIGSEFDVTNLSKSMSSSKASYHVAHIDLVPSTFFITSKVDHYLRLCAKRLLELISKEFPDISVTATYLQGNIHESKRDRRAVDAVQAQVFSNPIWWRCLPPFNVHDKYSTFSEGAKGMSPFGCSWRSLLKIKRTFEGFRSRLAVIPNLHLGLCPAEDQRFIEHQSEADQQSDDWPINLRLGVPTLNPKVKFLLATPPSLSWAFAVALEFYRLQAKDKTAQGSGTNLTVETVGVLENWISFMTYGTLLKEDSERYSYINKNLLHTTTSIAQRTSSWPSPLTIVVECSGMEDPVQGMDKVDERLVPLEAAWRNAVHNNTMEGHAIVLHESSIDQMKEAVAQRVVEMCKKRLA
ncbi:expressed conserved protein [Echinococcus multilocularis]|uniref:Expressed conserved protein n=1 Tax=Echinococcus multilocularis TaxID=6211 RepID=A0A068YHM2_ECHMU|nr:expressed conserved protein [Echinococcus multilocularis]